jgi:hypothetical protein
MPDDGSFNRNMSHQMIILKYCVGLQYFIQIQYRIFKLPIRYLVTLVLLYCQHVQSFSSESTFYVCELRFWGVLYELKNIIVRKRLATWYLSDFHEIRQFITKICQARACFLHLPSDSDKIR